MLDSVKESLLDDVFYPEFIRSKIGSYSLPGTDFYLKTTN